MTENNIKRKKASTAFGEVEYETVVCDSCDNEVMKDEAFRFVTIDTDQIRTDRSWSDHHEWEVYHGGYNEGWACPYCHEDGPVAYPRVRNGVEKFNALYDAVMLNDVQMWRMGLVAYLFVATLLSATLVTALIAASV